jgi:hypothetical protein
MDGQGYAEGSGNVELEDSTDGNSDIVQEFSASGMFGWIHFLMWRIRRNYSTSMMLQGINQFQGGADRANGQGRRGYGVGTQASRTLSCRGERILQTPKMCGCLQRHFRHYFLSVEEAHDKPRRKRHGGRFATHRVFTFFVFNMLVRFRNHRISMMSVTKKDFPEVERVVQSLSVQRLEKARD